MQNFSISTNNVTKFNLFCLNWYKYTTNIYCFTWGMASKFEPAVITKPCMACSTSALGQKASLWDYQGLIVWTMPQKAVNIWILWSQFSPLDIERTFIEFKGKFPQTTMWIGWVESNFRNPTVKVWANLDNPLKSYNFAKFCWNPCVALSR